MSKQSELRVEPVTGPSATPAVAAAAAAEAGFVRVVAADERGPAAVTVAPPDQPALMRRDFAAANKAAGLERTPPGFSWHHLEDAGTMMLVPRDLHQEVAHTGGRVTYKHRTGIEYGD